MIEIKQTKGISLALDIVEDDKTIATLMPGEQAEKLLSRLVDAYNKWEKVEEFFNGQIRNGPHTDELCAALTSLVGVLVAGPQSQPQTVRAEDVPRGKLFLLNINSLPTTYMKTTMKDKDGKYLCPVMDDDVHRGIMGHVSPDTPCEIVKAEKEQVAETGVEIEK